MSGSDNGVVRVTGTSEPADVAAVLAALTRRAHDTPELSPYERWRRGRTAALLASLAR
jgi:hypothetical protein